MPSYQESTSNISPVVRLEKAPRKKEEVISFVEDTFEFTKRYRTGLEYRVKEAIHFLGGDHWLHYQPYEQKFARHGLQKWHPTPTTNYLVKHYDLLLDMLISGDQHPKVGPATDDQDDVDAALATQRVLVSEYRRMKTDMKLMLPMAAWLILAGTCFIGSRWNAKSGHRASRKRTELKEKQLTADMMVCLKCDFQADHDAFDRCPDCGAELKKEKRGLFMPDGEPITEQSQMPVLDTNNRQIVDRIRLGELEEFLISPLNAYPMPCRNFEECRYFIEAEPMHVDQIKDIFGSKAAAVVAENLHFEEWGAVFNTALSSVNGQNNKGDSTDHALVKYLRHVPDRRFKKGMLSIVAAGELLWQGALDSTDGTLPIDMVKYRHIPGVFWGAGPFTDIVPQNKRVNGIDAHIIMHRRQMVNAQWLVPDGAGITHVSGQSGLVIYWKPHMTGGYKPERQPGLPMPPHVLEERGQTIQDMEELSGAAKIIGGGLPQGASGLETGPPLELLLERAFKRFAPTVKMLRASLVNHWHRNAKIIHKYWKEPRLVNVLGENEETEAFHYEGADIQGVEDMVVTSTLGALYSDTLRQQRVGQAIENGLLDPRDPVTRGRALEKMGIEGFDFHYVADAKKARRVLRALKEGGDAPRLLPDDNHPVQYSIIREFMLTVEFERLPEETQQAILERAAQHRQFMEQAQQKAMMAAQAAKGSSDQMSQAVEETGAAGTQRVPTQAVGG